MLALDWILSLFGIFLLGYYLRSIADNLKVLQQRIGQLEVLPGKKEIVEEPKSVIIDPTDIGQQVAMEQEEMMRQLNPEMYDGKE